MQIVDESFREKLSEAGLQEQIPREICLNCYGQFNMHLNSSTKVMARAKAKGDKKQIMWNQRIALVKKGHKAMEHKLLPDAIQFYEKYIRLMELVFDVEKGKLQPKHFKESANSPELTVIASVYWDLLRAYDANPKFKDRQMEVADQLGHFLPFTPVYPDITRKARSLARKAKNPKAYRHFLKTSRLRRPRCFIATAAFDGGDTYEVQLLSWFRDYYLSHHPMGRLFIFFYYQVSPPIARLLDRTPILKQLTRWILEKLVIELFLNRLQRIKPSPMDSDLAKK